MNVSIVIVNYNVKDLLLKGLQSLNNYLPSKYSYEIIVVDNNSTDKSCEGVRKKFPAVHLIENKINIGFSAANNQGIRIAQGDFIFLLNPDTELIDDSLIHLFHFVESNPDVIAAPKLLNSDDTFQNSCYRSFKVSQIILETFYLHLIFNNRTYNESELKHQRQVDAVSGAAFIFRKELISKIGLLDENLFWMEDIDFCYRNIKTVGLNVYLPQTVLKHHSGQSANKNLNISISNQIISKIKYIRKHGTKLELVIAILFSYFHAITRIIIFFIFSVISKTYFLKFKAYAYTMKKLTEYLFRKPLAVT